MTSPTPPSLADARRENLLSRIERAEDAAKHLDGDIGRMWAERYAGDVAFLLKLAVAARAAEGTAPPRVCSCHAGRARNIGDHADDCPEGDYCKANGCSRFKGDGNPGCGATCFALKKPARRSPEGTSEVEP